MVGPYLLLLALLAAERIFELRLSRRNTDRALARGGFEVGKRHFVAMRALHVAFFAGCIAEVVLLNRTFVAPLGYSMLLLALLAQALRYWAIRSLGPCWNVRVIVVPNAPVVTAGPYRYLRHPNYLAVIVEGFAVPLIHSAWITAAVFSALNAILLWVRIRSEEDALEQAGTYREQLGDRHRLLPLGRMGSPAS